MVSLVPDADRHGRSLAVATVLVLSLCLAGVAGAAAGPTATAERTAAPPTAPPGNVTLGPVPGTAFGTVEERTDTYVVRVTVERKGVGAPERRLVLRAGRRGEAVALQERVVSPAGREPYADTPARVAGVRVNGTGYRLRVYDAGVRPETLGPHLLVRGNRTYERVDPDHVRPSTIRYVGHVRRYSYVRAGTVTRDGERLVRYDALARRGDGLSRLRGLLAGHAEVAGHVLVDRDGSLRAARLRVPADEGYTELTYEARPGEAPSVPDWVDAARSLPPDPREAGPPPSHPAVRAYRTAGGVVLVANGTWTPPAGARVAVLPEYGDEPGYTATLDDSRSLFHPRGPDRPARVALRPDGDGGLVVESVPTGDAGGPPFERAGRVVVDVDGVNHYDVRVRRGAALGSLGTVTAARLRPDRGGGRALRVDDLEVGPVADPSTPVTLTVGNDTVSRSLTVAARNLSAERFFLVRTPDGLAALDHGGIAPRLVPPGGFAERRFVANATLTVEVDGVPVARREIERRLTQADGTPLPELLTGITVETYDEPPDRALLGRGDELEAMDWTNHTLVEVHVWDYDVVRVRGGARGLFGDDDCLEDQTCFYRAGDGAEFRVESARDGVLVAGVANGTRTYAP